MGDEQRKIAVAVRDDLETWQRLNVAAFVASGIGTAFPDLVGEPYEDASGVRYLRKLQEATTRPIVITAQAIGRALRSGEE